MKHKKKRKGKKKLTFSLGVGELALPSSSLQKRKEGSTNRHRVQGNKANKIVKHEASR
jgi:hypothetical protein